VKRLLRLEQLEGTSRTPSLLLCQSVEDVSFVLRSPSHLETQPWFNKQSTNVISCAVEQNWSIHSRQCCGF